jgi:hypothetical protein
MTCTEAFDISGQRDQPATGGGRLISLAGHESADVFARAERPALTMHTNARCPSRVVADVFARGMAIVCYGPNPEVSYWRWTRRLWPIPDSKGVLSCSEETWPRLAPQRSFGLDRFFCWAALRRPLPAARIAISWRLQRSVNS